MEFSGHLFSLFFMKLRPPSPGAHWPAEHQACEKPFIKKQDERVLRNDSSVVLWPHQGFFLKKQHQGTGRKKPKVIPVYILNLTPAWTTGEPISTLSQANICSLLCDSWVLYSCIKSGMGLWSEDKGPLTVGTEETEGRKTAAEMWGGYAQHTMPTVALLVAMLACSDKCSSREDWFILSYSSWRQEVGARSLRQRLHCLHGQEAEQSELSSLFPSYIVQISGPGNSSTHSGQVFPPQFPSSW